MMSSKIDTASSENKEEIRDRISELPDDILEIVQKHLKTKDAVATSLLSRRWKPVCLSASILTFDISNMFEFCKTIRLPCNSYKERFVRAVNQFLQSYKGIQLRMFAVRCCLRCTYTDEIDQWVEFALVKGVNRLALVFNCNKSCCNQIPIISYDDEQIEGKYVLRTEIFQGKTIDLERLKLNGCILGPNFTHQFSCLEDLSLSYSPLSSYDLHSLFSCMVKLQVLKFKGCDLPEKLCLGSLPLLRHFTVRLCTGLEEIKLSNVKLQYFECLRLDLIVVKCNLSGAPNLTKLKYTACGTKFQYVFTKLPQDYPLLQELHLSTSIDWVEWTPKSIATFSQVRKLTLDFAGLVNFGVSKIISILRAFPNLCVFHQWTLCEHDVEDDKLDPSEYVPQYLSEVEIGGFVSTPVQMALAIHLLKNARALKRLAIKLAIKISSAKCGLWEEEQRQMVYQRLQEFDKNGVLVVHGGYVD